MKTKKHAIVPVKKNENLETRPGVASAAMQRR